MQPKMWKVFLTYFCLSASKANFVSPTNGTFLYYAYGSNLLAERIHIQNPTAVRAGIGKLNDYRLSFATYSDIWKGAVATIENRKDTHVWGALWNIDKSQLNNLDKQEMVHINMYVPLTVNVTLENGTEVSARVYQQTNITPVLENIEDLPMDRRPSAAYLRTILTGANESGLPEEYQKFLQKIPDNGYFGDVDIGFKSNILGRN